MGRKRGKGNGEKGGKEGRRKKETEREEGGKKTANTMRGKQSEEVKGWQPKGRKPL